MQQDRVDADNYSSDYLLALQHWGHLQNLACLRENSLRSLHWWDPIEQFVYQEGDWFDLDYDACAAQHGLHDMATAFCPFRGCRPSQHQAMYALFSTLSPRSCVKI